MGELARRLGLANAAVAVELCAWLNHQLAYADVAVDATAGNDFETSSADGALKAAADQHPIGVQLAVNLALLANRDLRFGADRSVDLAVDVQAVAQGELADKLCTCCNDGRSGALAAVRTTSLNDSH